MDNQQNIIIGKRLKELRIFNDMEQQYVAHIMGYKSDTTISKWENGKNLPNGGKLAKLAQLFNTTTDYILYGENIKQNNTTLTSDVQAIVDVSVQLETPRQHNVLTYAKTQLDEQNNVISFTDLKEEEATYQSIYLYGAASAGKGLDLYDEVVEEIKYPKPVPTHDIALRVHGDSMDPMFRDGEIIFVKKSHEINHGQIGVFILNGQGYLKKFYRDVDGLKLVSLNKKYDDIVVQEFDEIQLTGVVVM